MKLEKKTKHTLRYIRANNCVTVGVDGVFGGVVPTANINMNFYTESAPLPSEIVMEVDVETGRVINDGTNPNDKATSSVREIVASVNVDITTAKSFYVWLGSKIKELESIQTSVKPLNQ